MKLKVCKVLSRICVFKPLRHSNRRRQYSCWFERQDGLRPACGRRAFLSCFPEKYISRDRGLQAEAVRGKLLVGRETKMEIFALLFVEAFTHSDRDARTVERFI